MLISIVFNSALASTVYPAELQALSGMECVPTCTVCHETNAGGTGTVTRELGLALLDRGLVGGAQTATLGTAFDALVADAVDSDGDGTPDADELAAGTDPNPDGVELCGSEPVVMPEYGCFNAGQAPIAGLAVFGALVGLVVGRRRG